MTALLLAAALGCGKQGPPLPPLRAVPAPTKDLAVEQQGPRLRMTLSYPQVTPAGTALQGISAVEICSTARPAPDGKAGPIDPRDFNGVAKPFQKIAGADLASATSGSQIEISLPLGADGALAAAAAPARRPSPRPRHRRRRARPPPRRLTGAAGELLRRPHLRQEGRQSDLSNIAAVVPKPPPAAPEHVTVTPRADGIQVEWCPVPGTAAGYNIYRRAAQERSNGKPVHTSGAAEKSWLDNTARFGQSYIYSVTALAQQQPAIESGIGSEREIHYVDRFAPPPPSELVALAEPGRVRLVWRASDADDLAGYIVYRRVGAAGPSSASRRSRWCRPRRGHQRRPGQTYTYRVTAIDQTGNESAPGGEVRADAP